MPHLYASSPSGSVQRARTLRRDMTDAEKRLWRALREAFPCSRFRRQVPIGPYFADFLSFGARLVIEVDGGQHAETSGYDAARTRFIEGQGYQVIRFWNHDVLQNIEGVLATIGQSLSQREREGAPEARKGEGDEIFPSLSPSPSHAAHGPLPLPMGEGL